MGFQENIIVKALFKKIMHRRDIRLFRNNVGLAFQGEIVSDENRMIVIKNYRRIRFGLIDGSGDYIGWKSVIITQEMVGKKIAQFLSVETKKVKGVRKPNQINWCIVINKNGGIGLFIDDPEVIEL